MSHFRPINKKKKRSVYLGEFKLSPDIWIILGSIAELEKNLISERIKCALAVKKMSAAQTGWTCGRKPLPQDVIDKIKSLRITGLSIRSIAKQLGISKTSVERVLNGKR